jgi:hypothetical protein
MIDNPGEMLSFPLKNNLYAKRSINLYEFQSQEDISRNWIMEEEIGPIQDIEWGCSHLINNHLH